MSSEPSIPHPRDRTQSPLWLRSVLFLHLLMPLVIYPTALIILSDPTNLHLTFSRYLAVTRPAPSFFHHVTLSVVFIVVFFSAYVYGFGAIIRMRFLIPTIFFAALFYVLLLYFAPSLYPFSSFRCRGPSTCYPAIMHGYFMWGSLLFALCFEKLLRAAVIAPRTAISRHLRKVMGGGDGSNGRNA